MEAKEEGKCVCEERVRAYMRMLRVGEGTGELIKSYDKTQKKVVYVKKDPQKGYTMAFGGNTITDLSKHPEKNYGGSTAAGAYQIMRYTWWWLNGEKLTDDLKKAGVYEKSHDYIKQYKIPNYNQESQDKLCLVIMKHKRSGLIEVIMTGDIENATRTYASLEWASLPHIGDSSRYKYNGKLQPATPIKHVLEHYEQFYQEELKGISNLHLKKGFLKEFGYTCQCGNKIEKVKKSTKKGYDIDKAISHLNSHAETRSRGKCALYVRQAINAGGIYNLSGHAREYYDTDKLVTAGFIKIGNDLDSIQLEKGDIVAFAAVAGHSYGHIAMYNGEQWVSDFKQNSFWVATQYSIEKKYSIYRWE